MDQEIMKKCNHEFSDLLLNKKKLSEEDECLQDAMVSIASKKIKPTRKIYLTILQYVPLHKNLYDEVPEIAKITNVKVDAYRRIKSKSRS